MNDKPNYRKPLDAWLERVGAQCLWSQKVKHNQSTIEAWLINMQVVLIQVWLLDGWQLYIPASDTNSMAATLDKAADFLGVDGCAGLLEG